MKNALFCRNPTELNISILTSGFAACSATKIAPSCAPVGAQAQAEGARAS